MDLQPYSHDCFSKILRTLFDFLNNTYWGSLLLRNTLLIFRTGVSCFSVTLFYSTLLAFTDRRNHRQRNEYTCCAWARETSFPVVLYVVSVFWFWWEIGFGVHTHVLRVPYSCGVVLGFWLQREIVFGVTYILSVQYSCAVVSVFWL